MKQQTANLINALNVDSSRSMLIDVKKSLVDISDPDPIVTKLKAEVFYLLARDYSSEDPDVAFLYAEQSKGLYAEMEFRDLRDATPVLHRILPEVMHGGVVERDFPSGKHIKMDREISLPVSDLI